MTKEIKLLDKVFELFIKNETIEAAVNKVAKNLNHSLKGRNPVFLCVLNGSFMFAADLLKRIDIPCEVSFVKLNSYSGTESTGKLKKLIGLNESLKSRTIVIVEDIVDSGNTITKLHKELIDIQVEKILIATLLLKPNAYSGTIPINYAGIEIPDEFIVGYGLDYNGYGRNLTDLYRYNN